MKQVFIQTQITPYGFRPKHNRLMSEVGFKKLGYRVDLISDESFFDWANSGTGIIHGSMVFQKKIWAKRRFQNTDFPYHPEELSPLIGRNVQDTTVEHAKKLIESGQSLFIKSHWTNRKAFAGNVLNSLGIGILNESDDTKVTIDLPCSFSSEWRLFIFDKKIVGAQFYKGDFRKSMIFSNPEQCLIDYAFTQTSSLPIAYCADFGFNDQINNWQLIECNDIMFANPYGLYPELYAQMIEARWIEISS